MPDHAVTLIALPIAAEKTAEATTRGVLTALLPQMTTRVSLYASASVLSFEMGQAWRQGLSFDWFDAYKATTDAEGMLPGMGEILPPRNARPTLPYMPADSQTACGPRCFPSGVVISAAQVSGAFRRWFDGEVITIRTAGGRDLTVTPNHPILTDHGFVAAGQLANGDNLISGFLRERMAMGDPYIDYGPTVIEQVFDAVCVEGRRQRMVGVPVNFHGDGRHGEIEVVYPERKLPFGVQSALGQPVIQSRLAVSDRLRMIRVFGCRGLLELAQRWALATGCTVRRLDQFLPFRIGQAFPPQSIRFAASTGGDVGRDEMRTNGATRYVERTTQRQLALARLIAGNNYRPVDLGTSRRLTAKRDFCFTKPMAHGGSFDAECYAQGVDRFARDVTTDKVVSVNRDPFHGFVYNLQTESGWYIANGIIVHNCRCYWNIDEDRANGRWICNYFTQADGSVCPDCLWRSLQNPVSIAFGGANS